MTDSFGTRLRRERERQQIALADIAARTKIKASLFEELERDDVSHWPSGIFRRSFIRSYAVALGLDADAVVKEFTERFPDPADQIAAGSLVAPMPGAVVRLAVSVGDQVTAGQPVLWLEAMKMQHQINAPADGVVSELPVSAGQQVDVGTVLAVVTTEEQ